MAEAKTPGTRAEDLRAAAQAAADAPFDLSPEIAQLGSYTRARLEGAQPKTWQAMVASMDKSWLAGIAILLFTLLASTVGLLSSHYGGTDARQDAAIASIRADLNSTMASTRRIQDELPALRDDNQEIKKIQWQLLTESLVQGRAFAEDRGLKGEAEAYTRRLKALNARIAASEKIEAAERAARETAEGGTR